MPHTQTLNYQIMALSAIRYCLGRHSYVVPCAVEWIQSEWETFTPTTQCNICLDLVKHLNYCNRNVEHDSDYAAWKAIGKWVYSKLPAHDQVWVQSQVEVWPL